MDSLSDSDASLVLVDDVRPGDGNNAPTPEVERVNHIPVHPSQMPNYVPGSGLTYAHDWSRVGTGGKIGRQGRHFVDAFGRVCSLRGVNVSGCSKIPANHSHDKFPADHHSVTFVGRPFPLEEAPQHFARLRRWGLSFIRFLITWEAVEHAGPGIYDMEYLTYIKNLLSMLPEYGLSAFVVIHQDVWSRYSGGSGAPAWTLENVGFDLHALEESGAAWLLGVKGGGHVEAERGIWPCGYQKLAAATMATCFWAGDTFAPMLKITAPNGDVKSVQQYLQDAFLDMYTLVAQTLGDVDGVLGFEMMNEPHRGYIDISSLHKFDYNTDLHLSYVPSAFESFMLGSGYPTLVSHWTRSFPLPTRLTSRSFVFAGSSCPERLSDPSKTPSGETSPMAKSFLTNAEKKSCWEVGYPSSMTVGRTAQVSQQPFALAREGKYLVRDRFDEEHLLLRGDAMNSFCPALQERIVKVCVPVDLPPIVRHSGRQDKTKRTLRPAHQVSTPNGCRDLARIINAGCEVLGEVPVLIGECGIPMDMNEKNAFKTENWTWQCRMMDAMMTGLERSLASFTLWNYNPDNTDAHGDDWNGENFSWFSRRRALPPSLLDLHQGSFTLDNGGRILPSVVRPYPAKTAGIPLKFEYEMNTGKFTFEWTTNTATQEGTARETEIYVPSLIAHGRKLVVEGLAPEDQYIYDESRQTLFVVQGDSAPGKIKKIIVSVRPPLRPHFDVNAFWGDFGELIASGLVVFIGIFVFIKFRFYI
ncbi:glycoside hydrolase family 5 protein [Paxillus involutus ATCC 200175]|nr:glycoside hydrolase family 5 protein [Paxillus involutus ATCC 200175]